MEKYRILRIETSGLKGLDKQISFDFENQTINKSWFNHSSIKAIYGPNGAGKTAFITSVSLYKNLCLNSSYLHDEEKSTTLKKLINKKTQSFYFKVFFCTEEGRVYSHSITLNSKKEDIFIKKEEIELITGRTINEDTKKLVTIEDGKLKSFFESSTDFERKIDSVIKEQINKQAEQASIISCFTNNLFLKTLLNVIKSEKDMNTQINNVAEACIITCSFISSVRIYLARIDQHAEKKVVSFIRFAEKLKQTTEDLDKTFMVVDETIVPIKDFSFFSKQVSATYNFIKLFKPELQDIKILKVKDKDVYHCRLEMVYPDYSVDFEYESAGIKNLIEIFVCLENAYNGGISFIDEIDANINEVYQTKLYSFFKKYSKGQLCMTIHNTSAMGILKKMKHSLDFINCNRESIYWVNNGSRNPLKDYSDGVIPGIPFNINDFDFLAVFER